MTLWHDYHLDNPRLEAIRLPLLGYYLAVTERWFTSGEVAASGYTTTRHFVDLIYKLNWLHEHRNELMPVFHVEGRRYTDKVYLPRNLIEYNVLRNTSWGDERLFDDAAPYFWTGEEVDADDLRTFGTCHTITTDWLEAQLGEAIIRQRDLPLLSARYSARWLAQQTRIIQMLKWGPCPFRFVYSRIYKEYKEGTDYPRDFTRGQLLSMIEAACLECDGAEEHEEEIRDGKAFYHGMYGIREAFRCSVTRGVNGINLGLYKTKRIEMILPTGAGATPTMLAFYLATWLDGDEFYAGQYEKDKRYMLYGNVVFQNEFAGYVPPPGDISRLCGIKGTGSYAYDAIFKDVWGFADYSASIYRFRG